MLRLIAALLLLSSSGIAQSYERLAAAAKLWSLVKYVHPRVTAPDVDWDRAFTDNAQRILHSSGDDDFAAGIDAMLGALRDPMTRVVPAERRGGVRFVSMQRADGVTVVTFAPGAVRRAPSRPLLEQLKGGGAVVFDLRDSPAAAAGAFPPTLPLDRPSEAPGVAARLHSGYQSPTLSGSGGYRSYWQTAGGAQAPASGNPIRAVFLVNSRTSIPMAALMAQASGAGAIVSEDPVTDLTLPLAETIEVYGGVRARVRARELTYGDGTTGVALNSVLNATGDAALERAAEMARTGSWPSTAARPRLELAPANFAEQTYSATPYPSTELRMLAAARIWGVFHYFHPYRYLYDENWDDVLVQYLAEMERAAYAREYHLAVAAMVAHTDDSHCFVTSTELNNFYGLYMPPVETQWIEERPVITRLLAASANGIVRPGDVVVSVEGAPVQARLDELAPYLAASTRQHRMLRSMQHLLAGPYGSVAHFGVQLADGSVREISMARSASVSAIVPYRSGPVYRLLDSRTGYVDLARLTNDQVNGMFDSLRNTDAIVMDMRGYPNATAWTIAPRLTDATSPVAAVFRRNIVSGMPQNGSFLTRVRFEQTLPATTDWRYHGRTVMLIDARAISQSEHSGLFFRAANGTKFIGSGTAGANGDVTYFYAPGGISINFTGHDVRWPDETRLQRVGLIPDVAVAPTIEGVRAGKDEILDRALLYLRTGQ